MSAGTMIVLVIVAVLAIVLGVPAVRRPLISAPMMRMVGRILPAMGETERVALEAGTVWWDGDLFSGKPNWQRLLDFQVRPLSMEEQAFLDGPVNELCRMLDDWAVAQQRDLPPEVWAFIKEKRFLGMIIPKEFGGLGFSAHAHSAVVTRIASRSVTAAVTVMVPNSLGPGELLLHYGTDAQKHHYLPKLARGEDIPCFALTEPGAGSDAANGKSRGVVCKGQWNGAEIVGVRVTFNKRYITLAPVATVVGLAFHLHDPDGLLGGASNLGITCALLPRDTPGMEIGNRHDPMGVPFQNGPVRGTDVFIPLDYIIGGKAMAGQGWRMLMEALAAGRSISLPAMSVGAAQLAARSTSAYGHVREQFGLPIGRFEGVRERLARIAGQTYILNAGSRLAFGAVDAGERPSVVSAIVKAYLTEGMRLCVNDAMDIHAGSAICRGPANIFSRPYISIPISITVEGANILTRSLIVFGQGAVRCHPYIQKEMAAVAARDVAAFDRAFFGHVGHLGRNALRVLAQGLSGGRLAAAAPAAAGREAGSYRQVARYSAVFAVVADLAFATLGGSLKRREYLSGRLADAFAWMFLATAVLKQFHDSGRPEAERPFLDWACAHALNECESALIGVLDNLPNRWAACAVRWLAFPFGRSSRSPTDRQVDRAAEALLIDETARDALTARIFRPAAAEPGLGALEEAYRHVIAAQPARAKLDRAYRDGQIAKGPVDAMARDAEAKALLSAAERSHLETAESHRDAVIQVSDFAPETFLGLK